MTSGFKVYRLRKLPNLHRNYLLDGKRVSFGSVQTFLGIQSSQRTETCDDSVSFLSKGTFEIQTLFA